jgi:hypothetical protein
MQPVVEPSVIPIYRGVPRAGSSERRASTEESKQKRNDQHQEQKLGKEDAPSDCEQQKYQHEEPDHLSTSTTRRRDRQQPAYPATIAAPTIQGISGRSDQATGLLPPRKSSVWPLEPRLGHESSGSTSGSRLAMPAGMFQRCQTARRVRSRRRRVPRRRRWRRPPGWSARAAARPRGPAAWRSSRALRARRCR